MKRILQKAWTWIAGVACDTCGRRVTAEEITTYVFGVKRCPTCTEAFDLSNYKLKLAQACAKRARYLAHRKALEESEDGVCPDDGQVCKDCCPHDDVEDGYCLDCEAAGHEIYHCD
jgi:hypothetical protein